jgi:DNA-binding Lrp family transcriptional regulator
MSWTFFTNHAHVLFCIAQDPNLRLRDVAERVGITQRATQRIVAELDRDGYLTRERVGRRNVYAVNRHVNVRHPFESGTTVGDLLRILDTD